VASATHLVLIPSYNTGVRLGDTVAEALRYWSPVWVVIDGSTDDSAASLPQTPGLRIIHRERNGGKGAAMLDGLRAAAAEGFTHVLVMDADGQHPAAEIADFMAISRDNPAAMILGLPIFDASAPRIRVLGRRISNVLARWETGQNIGDALFGFRIYPLGGLLAIMATSRHMRRYDFDTEAVVSLIAPRPVLFLTGDLDAGSPADGIAVIEKKVGSLYGTTSSNDRFKSIRYPDIGHTYTPEMRKEMLAWFERWLKS